MLTDTDAAITSKIHGSAKEAEERQGKSKDGEEAKCDEAKPMNPNDEKKATKAKPKAPHDLTPLTRPKSTGEAQRNPQNPKEQHETAEPKRALVPWEKASTVLLMLPWGRFTRSIPSAGVCIRQ